MAPKKKKTKPTANPARGFATTSIASKPRAEIPNEPVPTATEGGKLDSNAPPTSSSHDPKNAPPSNPNSDITTTTSQQKQTLSPEEFERQLEESELQLLVEKHAQKVKRDVQRQKSRLETDRRLLRGQAESLNTRKWLPQELMDHIMDMIQAESRYGASSLTGDSTSSNGKLPPEEDLVIKLWTLQQTLAGVGFSEDRVKAVIQYVLDIASRVNSSVKETIWGLEEALDWLARECTREELRDYDYRGGTSKSQADTPVDSPLASGANTPRLLEVNSLQKPKNGSTNLKASASKKVAIICHDEIEPDDLIPAYLDTKAKLFEIQRPQQDSKRGKPAKYRAPNGAKHVVSELSGDDLEEAKLLAKIEKIEQDVLFDKIAAEQTWRANRIELEKKFAAKKKAEAQAKEEAAQEAQSDDDEVTKEAERIAAEILQQDDADDDQALSDLFASLPVQEVDAVTGKTTNVINEANGIKITIRDFGKWTGISPVRALEEACRSRDSSVKVVYQLVSENPYSHRHLVSIQWSKPQELIPVPNIRFIDSVITPQQFLFQMTSIATPDSRQSEAYVATLALFVVFGSTKEEKVFMRLPQVWREFWSELLEEKKNQADAADRISIKDLRTLVRRKQDQDLEDGVLLQGAFRGRGSQRSANETGDDSILERGVTSILGPEYYQRIWAEKSSTPRFQAMLQFRSQLPMWQFRDRVLHAVENEQIVIICGETGCGKSTQVPSFLLEHQLSMGRSCKIYCTEPRRISAISLARRVSEELGEGRGDLGTSRSLVGYSIRLEANTSKETRLVYATTGIVMRMLEGSNELREITHLVLDEVHERSIDSDFLLIVLKKLLLRRKDLKVILMSATVDAERFSNYLGRAPVLTVPGRTFPVQDKFLEDALEITGYVPSQLSQEKMTDLDDDPAETDAVDSSSGAAAIKELKQYSPRTRNTISQIDEYQIDFELIVQLIIRISTDPDYVNYSKAILVFLPGIAEIRTLNDALLGEPFFQFAWEIFPLHSTIATEDQERAFLIPPEGVRKIVLATNIAETGITIPDVTCVIDTGKHREMRFDERRQLSRLIDTFISKANAKQRRGRAGRVQEGLCFHLFTKYRHDHLMSDQQTPEMLRLSLQDLAIRVKICKIGGIEETLGEALDAPSAKNIRRAIDALVDVRALTNTEELTPLGHQLARLPLDVFLGKLILQGTIFKCLDMAITVAAILSSKSPFTAPFGQRTQADQARKAFRRGDSDLLTVYNAYLGWKKVCHTSNNDFTYCKRNFLSSQTLSNIEDLKGQLLVALADSGFLQLTDEERRTLNRLRYSNRRRQFYELPQRVNVNSDNDTIAVSVISWSFYPKLLVREGKGFRNVGNNQSISLHPSSVNKGRMELKWLSYYHIMQSKQFLNAHETTAVENFAIALLCGDVRIDMYAGVIVLDGNRARFCVPDWKTLLVIKALRTRLRDLMTRSFRMPGKLLTAQQEKWLDAWQRVFSQDFGNKA
ncbi:P-loop containing nucleoside triphosphate hydrolase protein [Annulohypoxylon maeteangense]|uniref:P-loop containing nucleoside triphosphate hydrolase protein n=1 Tax=Annulohypoxylon maeteangense TaxID=1927788 RepID=UPI00200813BD|nr:P-loop containing nucleoside triphosphate hydrolase protein [Annulohypoxylon maeteangense]KAI0880682.1 P-loop containing nucleoside triphosphate hydrolase protein [Annulohypoxylon maeteangense]